MWKWKDKVTVMIVPPNRGDMSSHTVPAKLVWIAGIVSICFILMNIFLFSDYFDKRVDRAKLGKLSQENKMLSDQYVIMKESIDELNVGYEDLVLMEEAILTIFGLPQIDGEARLLGVGGPGDPDVTDITEATANALEISVDVDKLLRLAKFERERYQEVFDILSDKRDLLDHTPSIMPTKGYFSDEYGQRNSPFTGLREFHRGLDIYNHKGTPIYATADGRVASARANGGLGKMISIDHGYSYKTRYGHMSEYRVKVGQRIERGDIIGTMGSTGNATGPHVHYEVLKGGKHQNPYRFIINK